MLSIWKRFLHHENAHIRHVLFACILALWPLYFSIVRQESFRGLLIRQAWGRVLCIFWYSNQHFLLPGYWSRKRIHWTILCLANIQRQKFLKYTLLKDNGRFCAQNEPSDTGQLQRNLIYAAFDYVVAKFKWSPCSKRYCEGKLNWVPNFVFQRLYRSNKWLN